MKILLNLEYGRRMKLDISRKVPPSLKRRESSLISIFKSCFYEGCRWGDWAPKSIPSVLTFQKRNCTETQKQSNAEQKLDRIPIKLVEVEKGGKGGNTSARLWWLGRSGAKKASCQLSRSGVESATPLHPQLLTIGWIKRQIQRQTKTQRQTKI